MTTSVLPVQSDSTKRCIKCGEVKPLSEFCKQRKSRDGLQYYCKRCNVKRRLEYSIANPNARWRSTAFSNAKARAAEKGIPFDAEAVSQVVQTIPAHCPYLHIPLVIGVGSGHTDRSHCPSIDRIKPYLGYVAGNLQIISQLANRMKQDASLEMLLTFSRSCIRIHANEHNEDENQVRVPVSTAYSQQEILEPDSDEGWGAGDWF